MKELPMSTIISPADRKLVEDYFKHMQAGSLDGMLSIFAADGEYIEPFTANGQPTVHRGTQAIRDFFDQSFNGSMGHDVRLTLDRLDLDGDQLRSEWTCLMPMFSG